MRIIFLLSAINWAIQLWFLRSGFSASFLIPPDIEITMGVNEPFSTKTISLYALFFHFRMGYTTVWFMFLSLYQGAFGWLVVLTLKELGGENADVIKFHEYCDFILIWKYVAYVILLPYRFSWSYHIYLGIFCNFSFLTTSSKIKLPFIMQTKYF